MNITLTTMPVRNGNHAEPRLPQFRVTVNARCSRACFFCRPSGEAVATAAGMELKVDDLIAVAKVVRVAGITSIKLTGGDPALYGPLEDAVLRLRRDAGFDEVEVISRHPLIGERAERLAARGVTQFNISVDTLDKRLHHELCGVDDLPEVIGALQSCVKTGVPVKVNMVVMGGVNDDEVASLTDFCAMNGVRMLKLLDVIKDLDEGAESFARRLAIKRGKKLPELYLPLETFANRFLTVAVKREVCTQGGLGPDEGFHLQSWWASAMEAHGKGETRVVLRAQPAVRDELLRLTLKSNSQVEHTPDGGLVIRLYVDRWEWLIPLASSYGGDVLIEEPAELRDAIVAHLRRALEAYDGAARIDLEAVAAGFRNDDSRVRSTRGRTPTER